MKIFKHPILNHILYLFEHKIDNPQFEQQLFDCLMACDAKTLTLCANDYGNILSILCQLPTCYLKPDFEHRFIFLMNNIIQRLQVLKQHDLNIDLLLNKTHTNSIFILLLKIGHFQAAEICLQQLKIFTLGIPNLKNEILSELFQTNIHDQFYLTNLYRRLNWRESRQLTRALIKCHLYFNIPKELMINWLLSTVDLNKLDLHELALSSTLNIVNKQSFFDNLVLFCDFDIIPRATIQSMINTSETKHSLIDFILVQHQLDLGVFNSVLRFYEDLFRHHHLSPQEYHELIMCHPRPGFSPMHQLLLQGHLVGLSTYLNHLDYLLQQQILSRTQIKDAFLKTNTKGFTCMYQAVNNINEDIPKLFLQNMMQYFSKEEVLSLLIKGSYNPLYERHFRPRCANDKVHASKTNQMIANIRHSLKDELQRTVSRNSPASVSSFFSQDSSNTSPIPSDDIISLELEKLGIF